MQWNGPAGAGLGEMDRITSRIRADLRALPSVSDVAATLGRAVSGDQIVDANSGQIYVQIKPSADYDGAINAIRGIVQTVPGMRASVSTYEGDIQAGVLAPGEQRRHAFASTARTTPSCTRSRRRSSGLMSHVNGLGEPQVSAPTMEPNINVAIDDTKAHDAGVLPGDARRQASTLVSGLTVGNFFEQQAVFDAVVWSIPSVRANLQAVRNLPIDTSSGGHVPLSSIANVSVGPDPVDIQHQALSRYVDVTAPVYVGSASARRSRRSSSQLSQVGFPLDYHAEILGGTPENPTSHLKFLSFALAALVGILLLLQAAFGSWRLAALFFLALPVTLAGGLIVALATGQARSLGADAGLLAIFVFAVRQGMLQIARIRRLHAQDGGELTPRDRHPGRARPARAVADARCSSARATLIPFVVMGDVPGNEITHTAAAVILGGLRDRDAASTRCSSRRCAWRSARPRRSPSRSPRTSAIRRPCPPRLRASPERGFGMHFATRPLAAIAVLLVVGLAGCGSSSEPSIPVSGQLVGAEREIARDTSCSARSARSGSVCRRPRRRRCRRRRRS